ncbi:hypothetical protein J3D55_001070 [Chryseobacterium ginsenosidimutans]|uniref:bacteriocin-like protein n=1 Tax=Chryseobacterium ginsenosidimutans TaxID=687846 RepID=UPI0021678977|nr:hypothetical protein [Chryseobacterium ginsenosidimutans]MCS3868154.1 hypothetical protein [Chryseobacterium ginsenosidimutans]
MKTDKKPKSGIIWQKLLLNLKNKQMKNLKKLSRNELKTLQGGRRACSVAIQNSNGTWTTHYGLCASVVGYDVGNEFGELVTIATNGPQYCNFGQGVTQVTSNGGVSRCNS